MKKSIIIALILITIQLFSVTQRDKRLANLAYRKAKKLIEQNNLIKAKKYLFYAYKKNPNHPFVLPRIVVVLKKLKDYKNLLKYYKAYPDKSPNNFSANYNMGSFSMKAKEWTKAIKYLLIAHKIDKNRPNAIYNLSLSYLKIKNYDLCLKYSLIVYKKNFNPKDVLRNIVTSYLKLKKLDKALKYGKILVEKTNWTEPFTIDTLAEIYAKKKNFKKAIELVKKAIAIKKTALFKIHLNAWEKALKKQQSQNRPQQGSTTNNSRR